MLKQYKILVNEGKGSENVLVTVPAGAGARGNPTRITAKPDTRYELQDDLKGKGLGPDQVRGKRVGKNLYLMFEDNGKPDVIIEGYYDSVNLQQVPTIVGKAENGSVYEYIPHDPELSSMSTTLKDGYTPAMLSLGGGPIAGGAFELAGLPLVAAAAGGGLGGLGWLAAGLGAAALGGGGGGGGGTAGPVAPNGGVAPTVTITTDADNNGVVNKTELNGAGTFSVRADFDKTKAAIGDKVVFKDGGSSAVEKTVELKTQAMVDAGYVTADFEKPAEGATFKVSALLQRATLSSLSGTDSALLDTVSNADPADPTGRTSLAPVVLIKTDTNNDGYVNFNELGTATDFNVVVTFKGKVAVGDTVVITGSGSNSDTKSIVLTATDIAAGNVTALFPKPADGGVALTVTAIIKDQNGNDSPAGSDSAALDITAPEKNTLVELDPASDLGKRGDLITSDDTPDLLITAEPGATVKVTLLGTDYSANAKLNADGKYVVPVTVSLIPGLYIPQVTVTDKAGNVSSFSGAQFVVTNVIVNDDINLSVQADGGRINGPLSILTTKILGNDSDVYYDKILSPQSIHYLLPENNLTVQSISYLGNAKTVGVDFAVKYGTANINADGTFVYKVDGSLPTTEGLVTPVLESFFYSAVDKFGLVSKNTAKIDIVVSKDPNPSTIFLLKDTGYTGPANQLSAGSGITTSGPGNYGSSHIEVRDTDILQSFLDVDSNTPIKSQYGFFTITADGSASLGTMHSYKWSYALNTNNYISGMTAHDLITVNTLDGSSYQTLEAVVGTSGQLTTAPNQYYYTATAKGLTATGSTSLGITDTLFLKSDGLFLDLTAATTNVSGMEWLDITGAGSATSSANTVKISLGALTKNMDSNHHQLYIIGDSGDKVQLVGTYADWGADGNGVGNTTLHTGYITYTHNQDELIIQNTIKNITFV